MSTEDEVRLFTRKDGLEQVTFGRMKITLLAAGDGIEVIRHEMEAGMRWGLYPETNCDALETVVVLSGRLAWYGADGATPLQVGDALVAHPVQREISFEATTRVHFLYICSQPVFRYYRQQAEEMEQLADRTVEAERKVGHPNDHCHRVADLSMKVGQHMKLEPDRLAVLNHGAFLHDLGTSRIPEHILTKTGPLTNEDWKVVRCHPLWGRDMIAGTSLGGAASVLEQHHERWDGSGYPEGRQGEATSIEAHIVGLVDSFTAMTATRVYISARSPDEAIDEIERNRGVLYHPDVVDAFMAVV